MKESKKILKSLLKVNELNSVKRTAIQLPKKYRVAIKAKYPNVEDFEKAVDELYQEVKKMEE